MKKFVAVILVLSMMAVALCGCGTSNKHFMGEWKFSQITKVEIDPNVSATIVEDLMQEYGVADKKSVEESALAAFIADGIFAPCYFKYTSKNVYTYDPAMNREATWVFYQTGENEGFISFYAELDVAEGNPDPVNNPYVTYDPEAKTLTMTIKYVAFLVTIELTK